MRKSYFNYIGTLNVELRINYLHDNYQFISLIISSQYFAVDFKHTYTNSIQCFEQSALVTSPSHDQNDI